MKRKTPQTPEEIFLSALRKARVQKYEEDFMGLKKSLEDYRTHVESKRIAENSALEQRKEQLEAEISELENKKTYRIACMKKDASVGGLKIRSGGSNGTLLSFKFPEPNNQALLWSLGKTLNQIKQRYRSITCLIINPQMSRQLFGDSEKKKEYGNYRVFITDKVDANHILIIVP